MEVSASERRISRRLQVTTPLRVRAWKSGPAERRTESVNISKTGAFFATDMQLAIGSAVEIPVTMPEEISGKPTTDWRCTGHVVRLQPVDALIGKLGVGVQRDYHEILRSNSGG